jgi:hypothetical protein
VATSAFGQQRSRRGVDEQACTRTEPIVELLSERWREDDLELDTVRGDVKGRPRACARHARGVDRCGRRHHAQPVCGGLDRDETGLGDDQTGHLGKIGRHRGDLGRARVVAADGWL